MKRLILLSLAGLLMLNACSRHKSGSNAPLDLTNESNTDGDSGHFIEQAAPGGMMEVIAGTLAQKLAENPRVKNFGAMMIRDHNQANKNLKILFDKNKLIMPASLTPEQQAHLDALSAKKGQEFDRAYMQMMVQDHKKTVDLFQSGASSRDGDISRFAKETLPTLKMHLDSATAIYTDLQH